MSPDRKRKALGPQSRSSNKLSASDKLAKLLVVEEMAASRRRRRRVLESPLNQTFVKHWRPRVVQWFFDMIDHFELSRDVVYVAAYILDRYTIGSSVIISSSQHYQEVSIAAIFLAAKTLKPSIIAMESLLQTMGNTCKMTTHQAMGVVREVVSALDWTYPILAPSAFAKQLLGITACFLPESQHRTRKPLEHLLYLTELAVLGNLSSKSFASDIALAALIQTMNPKTGPADCCCLTQESFQGMAEKLRVELNLDVSNETIQHLCQELEGIHAKSLDWRSAPEPRAAPSKPTPVLIEEENEQETICGEEATTNNLEEYNHATTVIIDQESTIAQSPPKRIRTV
ncbi:MAG: hypothetical protein SGBAC_002575 [Bacillariaceae sp.]